MKKNFALVSLVLLSCCNNGSARLSKYFDLKDALTVADTVAVGQFTRAEHFRSSSDSSGVPVQTYKLYFQAISALKGNDVGELPIEIELQGQISPRPPVLPAGRKITLLKRRVGGGYEFADDQISVLPTRSEHIGQEGDLLQTIARELSSVLRDRSQVLEDRLTAATALENLNSTDLTESFRTLLAESDNSLRAIAMVYLVRRDDPDALKMASRVLLDETSEPTPHAKQNLAASVRIGARSEKDIPVLLRLANSPDTFTRRSVLVALGQIKTPSAEPILAAALADRDSEVRYWATVGLANTTGQQDWNPSMEQFRLEESKFLSHWQEWARTTIAK